jgi:hypothetical protein
MADVRATIGIAKIIKDSQPRLFKYALRVNSPGDANLTAGKNELSLANLNFKQIQFRNREVILRDHLNSFLQNALEIFSFAERNKNSLRRIILLPS